MASESDKHYIIEIHVHGMNARDRDRFFDRIADEAHRFDEDVFVSGGPCEEGDECHGEDDD